MSYTTIPEGKRNWLILWRDGSASLWPCKLWPREMLEEMYCVLSFEEVR